MILIPVRGPGGRDGADSAESLARDAGWVV
jgi:hypothetical protein